MLRSFWTYRHLLRQLVQRNVASRYRGSLAGLLWSLVMPCVMLGVYLFVFGHIFVPAKGATTATNASAAFVLSLFAGMLLHGLVAECLGSGPAAILSQPSYVKKVVFPIELLPLTVVGTALVQFLIGSGVLVLALLIFQGLTAKALLWPLAWLPLLAFAAGITFILAALTVYLRDLAQLTGFFTTILLFLSPVFYSLESAPAALQSWLLFNPLTIPIEATRSLLIRGQWPSLIPWLVHSLACLITLYAGWWVFQRTRRGFADVI
jgi:lipopolysaccharide transport system permease protein